MKYLKRFNESETFSSVLPSDDVLKEIGASEFEKLEYKSVQDNISKSESNRLLEYVDNFLVGSNIYIENPSQVKSIDTEDGRFDYRREYRFSSPSQSSMNGFIAISKYQDGYYLVETFLPTSINGRISRTRFWVCDGEDGLGEWSKKGFIGWNQA